ncbi:MAG TPA: DUF4342 domain-containing protein, partial [Gemmatimonadaceae bacterium]|nr:DUF4342 domain-containing protein [Gemmatimonadaceae bacterium]
IIREGNVRRVILRNARGRTLLDMPLAAGIAGAVLLPFWVAVGAAVALATDFTILVERDPDLPANSTGMDDKELTSRTTRMRC